MPKKIKMFLFVKEKHHSKSQFSYWQDEVITYLPYRSIKRIRENVCKMPSTMPDI